MDWIRRILWKLGYAASSRLAHREFDEEVAHHIAMLAERFRAQGMSRGEALHAARRQFGNLTTLTETRHDMQTTIWLETLWQDIRYGGRTLTKNPGFAAVAVLTLALGIGANTAIFSVVNSVLLKPLRYPHAEELVALRQFAPGAAGLASFSDGLRLSPSMYFTYAEHNRTFQSLGVWVPASANLTGLGDPERVRTVLVSGGVLESFAVSPAVGRWLGAADQVPKAREGTGVSGRSTTAMLSYGYWQRRFGGDPSVIGRAVMVDSRPCEIVGVMPSGFRVVDADFDLILPLVFDRGKLILAGFGFNGIGRLKPGIAVTQANADLARMVSIWMDSWTNGPGTNSRIYETWRITPAIRPLKQEVVGNIGDVLWVVMGTIGLVMLIACANLTNLLMVRAEVRQQELAMRAAIGAGRARLIRMLVVESVILGLIGGAFGVGVAYGGLQLLLSTGPANLPRLSEISIDPRTLGFALILSLGSGLLLGLLPALKYAGARIASAMRGAGRTASMSRERHRARNALVVVQVSIALVLLIGAGLMIRTFQALRTVDPGFTDPGSLQILRISIPVPLVAESQMVTRTQNSIQDKLAAIPGVTAVGFASAMAMEGIEPNWDAIQVEGRPDPKDEIPPLRYFKNISPGFLKAAGTRLIAGRDLTWTEVYGFRPAAIISENLARELWGTPTAALGKRIRAYPTWAWREVIGVVQDVRENGVDQKAPSTVYWPSMMAGTKGPETAGVWRTVTFAVRSERAGTEAFLHEIRQAVWDVNGNLPVTDTRTMQEVYDRSMARSSFTLVMLSIAGMMALLLGVIGIYGVISYAVSQRTKEIGIRLALGAQPRELKRMFVRSALALTGVGLAIGLVAAAGLTRLMNSLLFGISPLDPLTYAAVPVILVAAALLGGYLPARRAAAVDPVEALKAE